MKNLVRVALALFASASPLLAQAPDAGPRWTGWLGCWSVAPADMQAIDRPDGARLICVTPTADANVAHVSLRANGKEFFRDTIDASGKPRQVERNGCKGSERATWSSDGRRVFIKSSVLCGESATDVAAILSLSPAGEWVDVRSIHTGAATDVQVTRYRDVGTPSVVPAEIASLVTQRADDIKRARAAAAAKLESRDITEVWKAAAEPTLVEVWLLESGLSYAVDSRGLQQLADAGVPAQVTDAVVTANRAETEGSGRRYAYNLPFDERMRCYGCERNRGEWDQTTGQRIIFQAWQYEDPWNYSIFRGFMGPYGQFGYPNRIRGYDATYGILGAGAARSTVPDLRPPVITLTNNVDPNAAKTQSAKEAKDGKDESGPKQVIIDAITSAAVEKAKNSKSPSSPTSPKGPHR